MDYDTFLHLLWVKPSPGFEAPHLCNLKFKEGQVKLLSRIEELAKAGTCAHDRRALQQLAMNDLNK